MHSDPAEIKKSVRTYMIVGAILYACTVLTVTANHVHLVVPLAITVALIIATVKGSLVASVFMHLNHEKKWIYGALLATVMAFIVLMSVPFLTVSDEIGSPSPWQTQQVQAGHVVEH